MSQDQSASTGGKLYSQPDPNSPTDKKKREKAAIIKAHAKELFNELVIQGYQVLATRLRDENLSNEEMLQIQKQYASIRADLCITFASEFEETWKKRRGQFLS